jgi:acyl-CoA synthetase (AMP-forming)/AMP-acid ligase II
VKDIYDQKPWLKFYDKRVPATLEYPAISYPEFIREAFEKVPDRVALYYMGSRINYRDLDTLSSQFAHFLAENGCRPGDTVGVHLPNIPACYISCLGILKAGCVYTGASVLMSPDELEQQINDAGVKILLTLDALFGKVGKIVERTGVKTVVVASIADFLLLLKKVLGKLLKKIPTGRVGSLPGIKVIRFSQALEAMPRHLPAVKVNPEAPCFMMYTGGTTGRPKGAVLTHRNVVRHMVQNNTWLGLTIGAHTTLCPYPMFHVAGCFIAMGCIALGNSLIPVLNPRDLKSLISAIRKYKPTSILAVPTLYLELMKLPEFRALDFSGIQYFISGSAPFPAKNIHEFEELVGNKLIEGYGLTEATTLITSLPHRGQKKVGSVGIPLSDTEVRLVDPESGQVVPLGEAGEIVARGPQVFQGYHNQPEETARTVRDGWLYTGDIAEMDQDGYFTIVDRVKDMVNVSGFKVFTRVVDEVLVRHPDVDSAATVGLPDPNRPGSEIVASAIVLKAGREKNEAMKQQIIAYMKGKVASYKVPRVIEFMDQLPLSPIGKVLKRELRKMISAG